jgi:phosphatidylglycerophosphate synthase
LTLAKEQDPQRLSAAARLALMGMALLGAAVLAVLMALEQAGLTATVTAAAVYSGVALLARRALLRMSPQPFGAANGVTLARAALTAALMGVAIEALLWGAPHAKSDAALWAITGAAAIAWALDAVDGWVARRLALASDFGARFDMEVDALFILALSLLSYAMGRAGGWVLLAGLLRYGFVAASLLWPGLAAPLPPSLRRRTVCALMSAALVVATVPLVPPGFGAILLGMGVVALVWSFAVDIAFLIRRPAGETAAARAGS